MAAGIDAVHIVPGEQIGQVGEAMRNVMRLGKAARPAFVVAEDADDTRVFTG